MVAKGRLQSAKYVAETFTFKPDGTGEQLTALIQADFEPKEATRLAALKTRHEKAVKHIDLSKYDPATVGAVTANA
jgi:hypothetical protein